MEIIFYLYNYHAFRKFNLQGKIESFPIKKVKEFVERRVGGGGDATVCVV